MTEIDTQAFLADLYELRAIGRFRTGVHRPTFSAADMESRRWLMARLEACGLEAAIDGIGNVLGRHRGPGPHLLVGSHIETQNEAGWLDGALGVVAGVALARAGLPVDVVAFADEEGHFSGGFLGSRSAIGDLTEAEIDAARNRTDGTPLRAALATAGLAGLPRMRLDPARYRGFLEMHIEQGTQLESAGLHLGVVSGIVAIWQFRIVFDGNQDHAGGTTMAERRDAGLSAVRLLAAIDRDFPTGLRPAQHLDHGADHPGSRRLQHHPGPRRGVLPVPRRVDAGAGADGGLPGGAGARIEPARALPRHADGPVEGGPRPLRPGPDARPLGGRRGGLPGRLAGDALGRRPRRPERRPDPAGRDAVRALDRRHQPPLGGGHRRRRPGARACGRWARRRRGCWRGEGRAPAGAGA